MADPIDPAEHQRRIERVRALLNSQFAGNKAELGRAMGWKDGAYVRQLVEGERPITEKLVAKIETMSAGKYRGWFAQAGAAPKVAPEAWPLDPYISRSAWAALSPEQRGVLAMAAAKALREVKDLMNEPEALSGKRSRAAT